nr:protein FAM181B-like [Gorilla gorilla gorilla]
MGPGAMGQGAALIREAWAAQEPMEVVGGSGMVGCRSRALPRGKAAKAPVRNRAQRRWAGTSWGPSTPSAATCPGAKPLIAWGRQGRLAAPSVGPAKPMPTRNSSWLASAARSPGSRSRLSLHTSLQAEGAGSGLGQPGKGLPQCSGGLKGFSSAAKVGAQAEEAPRRSEGCEDCQHAVTSQS